MATQTPPKPNAFQAPVALENLKRSADARAVDSIRDDAKRTKADITLWKSEVARRKDENESAESIAEAETQLATFEARCRILSTCADVAAKSLPKE